MAKTLATLTGKRIRRWQQRFLRSLRKVPNVTTACAAANISRQNAYRQRENDLAFAEKWQDALDKSIDELEARAFALALKGDSRLVEFMLKSHRPSIYRETQRVDLGLLGGIVLIPQKTGGAE